MKRRLATLLTCALIAFGQRSKPQQDPPVKPTVRYVDLLAVDAAGRPVPDLSAEDFELMQSGEARKITQAEWLDARLHTARGGPLLELGPDQIHRNFIAIVDDLGLPADGILSVQESLRGFVKDRMGAGERMAVLRTSSGTGILQQLTEDRRILTEAIDGIQFLGGSVPERTAAGASWLTLRQALQGLQQLPGRKFVVLFSQALRSAGIHDPAAGTLFSEANAAMASVYGVDPRGPVREAPGAGKSPPFEELARETGGVFGADLPAVLQAEEGFYAVGFEEPATTLAAPKAWDDPVTIKVRRAGVTIRARSRYLTVREQEDFPAPQDRAVQIRRALASPFQASGVRARLTATFAGFAAQNADVEVGVLIDLRDLGVICDSKGVRRASLRMVVDANSDRGASTMAIDRNYDLVMPAEAYQKALRTGMLFTVTLHLPAAGIWRVRAVAADGVSDRLGSSVQCLDVPARDAFSMTGLALRVFDPDGVENPPAEPKQNEAARIFRSGRTLQFSYFVFNPLADESKQAHLEIITRLYVKGHAAFVGAPSQVPYANEPGTRRQITQRLKLSAEVVPGDYILEVTVSDKLAPPAAPRSVSRFIDFQVLD